MSVGPWASQVLRGMNPWWTSPDAIRQDREVRIWHNSGERYRPALMGEMALDFESDMQVIYTVRGSRQVGKTTMVKLQIMDLLDRGVDPQRVLYYSFGPRATLDDLYDVMLGYLSLSERARGDRRCYIFLDEISYVPQWQEGLKDISNMGRLVNCTIVATGSNSTDLTHATETLTGRMGLVEDGNHKSLLPMNFREFVSIMNNDLSELAKSYGFSTLARKHSTLMNITTKTNNEALDKLAFHMTDLDMLFMQYMVWGGIPHVTNMCPNPIPNMLYNKYLDGILDEWKFLGYSTDSLRGLAPHLVDSAGSTFSWNSMADALSCSRQEAKNQLYALRDMYVISVMDNYNVHGKSAHLHKSKKLHFRDPLFYHMFDTLYAERSSPFEYSKACVDDPTLRGHVAECVMADHLSRFAYSASVRKAFFNPADYVYYWKSGKHEVDYVYIGVDDIPVPIEVKYRSKVDYRNLGGMAEFLNVSGVEHGIVATRREYEIRRDYALVPLPMLLMLM